MLEQFRSRARPVICSLNLFLIKIHLIYCYSVEGLLKSHSHFFTFAGYLEEKGLFLFLGHINGVCLIDYRNRRLDHIVSCIPNFDLLILKN